MRAGGFNVLCDDFVITIADDAPAGYPVTAVATGMGRVSRTLSAPDDAMADLLVRVAALAPDQADETLLRAAGAALFDWLISGPLEVHLRIAWDRAERGRRGLRLRLSIDPPEAGAWPWEILRDPVRDHVFATAIATPLVRYLDRTDQFGGLADQAAGLPLDLLLVLPSAPELDLVRERQLIEEATASLKGELRITVLEGMVTRGALADALLAGAYDIVHFSGHGAFGDGRGYVLLNHPDGTPDWVDGQALAQLALSYRSIKLVVLNACSTGQTDSGRAFQGLAPQLVRRGIPAVVAMQYPLTDQAALTFAREFYRNLCVGENAGQVDQAITYARNMLTILYPGERSFVAPVLFTHAPDGVIYTLPHELTAQSDIGGEGQHARLSALVHSLQASMGLSEDWAMAAPKKLKEWRDILQQARDQYRSHLNDPQSDVRQAARLGVTLTEDRLAALDAAHGELCSFS